MITGLSILIPAYNSIVAPTVKRLSTYCERIAIDSPQPFDYEIIVADDGSDQAEKVDANKVVNSWRHCRYIVRERNRGSAATRNFLAQQSRHEWLLFIDSDMEIPGVEFVMRYLTCDHTDVTNGGIKVGGSQATHRHNLRYLYEKKAERQHQPDRRQAMGFQQFRSANFLIRRTCMIAHPFDERFRKSGYEDVLLGKTLQQAEATILHIDNPLVLNDFEDNPDFIRKTEHHLRTLHTFRHELKGYSRLMRYAYLFTVPLVLWHFTFGPLERRILTGKRPSLPLYALYRLGFYASFKD